MILLIVIGMRRKMKVKLMQKFQTASDKNIVLHHIATADKNVEKGKYTNIEITKHWNYGTEYKIGLMFGLAKIRDIYDVEI